MGIEVIDVSHWNWPCESTKMITDAKGMMVKATEGATFKDPRLLDWLILAQSAGLIAGMYHFARPDQTDVYEEFCNFRESVFDVFDQEIVDEVVLAIDWEGPALKSPVGWAVEFIELCKDTFGKPPLFYASQGNLKNMEAVQKTGAGLWVAHYSNTLGAIKPWEFAAMWQYTSKPWDKNTFFGDTTQLKAYAVTDPRNKMEEMDCCTCSKRHCCGGCCG